MSSQKCVVTCIKASSTARLRLEILSDGVSEHQILKTFLVCVCVCVCGGGGGYGVPNGTKSHAQSSNHFFNYTVMLFINRRPYT